MFITFKRKHTGTPITLRTDWDYVALLEISPEITRVYVYREARDPLYYPLAHPLDLVASKLDFGNFAEFPITWAKNPEPTRLLIARDTQIGCVEAKWKDKTRIDLVHGWYFLVNRSHDEVLQQLRIRKGKQ